MNSFLINTEAEYNEALTFIDRDIELYDFDLSRKMTSLEYNLYFQDTEYYLDFLYEKTRTVEDIIDYIERYGNKKIEELNKLFEDNLEVLESAIDRYVDNAAVSLKPQWDFNPLNPITDRDGSVISVLTTYSDGLVVNKNINYIIPIKSATKTSNYISYSDNIEDLVKDGYYISDYNLDKPDEIKEDLVLEIDNPDDLNYIDIKPLNCEYEINLNDDKQLVITLISKNYIKEYENFDYNNFIKSNLDSIKSLEMAYNLADTINSNQNKLADLKDSDYRNKYINKVLEQQKTRADLLTKSNQLNTIQKG